MPREIITGVPRIKIYPIGAGLSTRIGHDGLKRNSEHSIVCRWVLLGSSAPPHFSALM